MPHKLEGLGLYSHEVLSRLVKAYPEHEFVFAFDRKFDPSFVYNENVTPLVVPPPARHPLLFYWWFEWSLPRIYKQYRCDAFLSPTGFTSLDRRIEHNVIVVHDLAYLHHPGDVGPAMLAYYRKYTPLFIEKASEIVTISKTSFDDLVKHFPKAAAKTTWSYNGVREIFTPLEQGKSASVSAKFTEGAPYFIVVGSFNHRKNVARIVQAYDLYRSHSSTSTKLLVVGRKRRLTSKIESILKKSSFAEDVIFTGYLSDMELVEVLGAAEALLYMSLFEGFGLPILEAMACGTPVITSDRSSMKEIAEDKALTVDPESISAIAGAMEQISNNADMRADLIKKGLAHSSTFSWDPMVKTVAAALRL